MMCLSAIKHLTQRLFLKMSDLLITGGTGMIGAAFKNILPDAEYPTRRELYSIMNDPVDQESLHDKRIVHLAAKVGGVKANTAEVAEFYMQNSWAVKHLPGDEAQSHTHTGSLISGVYYLHTPKDSGNITFSKEYCYTNMFPQSVNFAYDEFNLVNCEKCTIEVENGKILLFPSHLLHSVEKNNTSEDRYSLAFNFYVRGKFGEKESVLEIK